MRMAALSTTAGVPVPTIKFYLRERLLPAGRRTSPNQSHYDDSHLQRLQLIRALTEVAGLSLSTVADVIACIDRPSEQSAAPLIAVHRALSRRIVDSPGIPPADRYDMLDAVIRDQGWNEPANADNRAAAAVLLGMLERMRVGPSLSSLRTYAQAARMVAEDDLRQITHPRSTAEALEALTVAGVLGSALLGTLRQMAQISQLSAAHRATAQHETELPATPQPPTPQPANPQPATSQRKPYGGNQ